MQTLGSKLDTRNGISHGFDFLRVFLALSVLFVHSFALVVEKQYRPPNGLMANTIVPMFFALSGFLITSSATRLQLKDFILNRAIRIVPALAVDIFISALVLGPIFTTLPLKEYFTSHGFFSYFMNLTGFIHYVLPGVFTDNTYDDTVNRSLWTIPFEIGCYCLISGLILMKLLHKRTLLLLISLVMALVIAGNYGSEINLAGALHLPGTLGNILATCVDTYFSQGGKMLYIYFLAGSVFYLFRNEIPYSPILLAVMLGTFIALAFQDANHMSMMQKLLCVPVVVYIMAYVGVSDVPRLPLFHHGDYSYGIYLYGYPLQQSIIAVLLPYRPSGWLHYALSAVIVTMVAMVSWHYVEKPILRIRKKFSFTARKGDADF